MIAMTGGGVSVFRTALEGLDELRSIHKDGDLLAAAIAVAENQYGYATGEERENVVLMGVDQKEVILAGKTSQGLKLLMSWLSKEGLLDQSLVREDKIYSEANDEAAERAGFLAGASEGRKKNWIQNYNAERSDAFKKLDRMFVRTYLAAFISTPLRRKD